MPKTGNNKTMKASKPFTDGPHPTQVGRGKQLERPQARRNDRKLLPDRHGKIQT